MKAIKYIIVSCIFLTMIYCSEDRIDGMAAGIISGIVVTVDTNERVEDVRVSTVPATSTVFTDNKGEFTIENVPEGSYSVQASKDGFVTAFEPANVLPNVTVDLVFDFEEESALNDAPSTPILLTPENNAVEVPVSVDLTWEATDPDEDELLYKVSLFNENNDDVQLFEELTEPLLTLTELTVNTKYFWQVTVSDGQNTEVLSEVFSFRTITSQTGAFLLVKEIDNNQVIFSSDDEGALFQLTSNTDNSFKPRRNLASNKIAFLRTVGGQIHLFTMDFDGSNKTQVTSTIPVNGFNFEEIEFAWKPEGDKLLYPSFDKIYSINTDGSGVSEFYSTTNNNFVSEIAWSAVNNVIAIKTNNSDGYNAEILILDENGLEQETIVSGVSGAVGGLDLNINGNLVLYTLDVSGLELPNYRIQDARLFMFDRSNMTAVQLLTGINNGFIELDPKFSPAEDLVIYQYKARNLNAASSIRSHDINVGQSNSVVLFENAVMPDWED